MRSNITEALAQELAEHLDELMQDDEGIAVGPEGASTPSFEVVINNVEDAKPYRALGQASFQVEVGSELYVVTVAKR